MTADSNLDFWHEVNRRALTQPCPQCGLPAQAWCLTPSGRRATSLHARRTRQAQREVETYGNPSPHYNKVPF